MKYIEKRKIPNKQALTLIITAATLAVLIAATVIIKIVVDNLSSSNNPPYNPPELEAGEALVNDYYTVAYPQLEPTDISLIRIATLDGQYALMRPDAGGDFRIYYTPEGSENLDVYLPPITGIEAGFNYASLFAAGGNSYGITNVYYLCSVIGTMYFDSRIELPEDEAEREEILSYYGLGEQSNKQTIDFTYKDSKGETKAHSLIIGDKMITDTGYYYMVDGRDFIYVTTSSFLDYALGGAASLINSTLVSAGLAADSSLEPYLTPEYKQWTTTLHDKAGDVVAEGSDVIVNAEIVSPQNPTNATSPDDYTSDGYVGGGVFGKTNFDLSYFTGIAGDILKRELAGKTVGSYEGAEISFTVIGSGLLVNIPSEVESVTYNYTVTAIEAILDGGDNNAAATVVGDNNLIKVTYTASSDGESITPAPYHAVIDLSSELIDAQAVAEFRAASIGTLQEPIEFSVTYDKEGIPNEQKHQLVVTKIISITDSEGKSVDTVSDGCIVEYVFVLKSGDKDSEEYLDRIDLGLLDDPEKQDEINVEYYERMRELLRGKKKNTAIRLVASEYYECHEVMNDFDVVTVKEIYGFITSEIKVSFKFINEDLRDPFYGESIYENTLESGEGIYALNNGVCENVLEILGGIGETAGQSDGLIGLETVAVGLNTSAILKYFYGDDVCDGVCDEDCLADFNRDFDNPERSFAHKIRFVLPRNISDVSDTDDPSYYVWSHTLTFTLYVSREHTAPDGSKFRYIASDMYDVVTKISAENLVFLNYDFVEFWARRTPLMLDVNTIESLKLNFNMSDVYGSYDFSMTHTDYYYDANGNKYTEDAPNRTHDNFIKLFLSVGEGAMDSAVSDYIAEKGIDGKLAFSEFFDSVSGGGMVGYDTRDVESFKNIMQKIYLTRYTGMLTEEEQEAGALLEPIFSMELKLSGSSNRYLYEFRRIDERRVMVTLTRTGSKPSSSSDFYISSAALREIVGGFVYLINGLDVDAEESYQPLP